MQKHKINSIIKLAKNLRPKLNSLAQYNMDDINLKGYCAVSSWLLMKEANKINLYPKLIVGHFNLIGDHNNTKYCNHAWLQYYGKIIDVTATQFSVSKKFDDIHITTKEDNMYLSMHNKKHDVLQCLSTWPKLQNPLHPESFLKNIDNIKLDSLRIAC